MRPCRGAEGSLTSCPGPTLRNGKGHRGPAGVQKKHSQRPFSPRLTHRCLYADPRRCLYASCPRFYRVWGHIGVNPRRCLYASCPRFYRVCGHIGVYPPLGFIIRVGVYMRPVNVFIGSVAKSKVKRNPILSDSDRIEFSLYF